ncbi:hypothetical protein AURDEDRAFT_183518 [Auricularia subglabra TFB-10046 SS5]|nr:hypothetical protein AURDEDRAFT_183518 [Auricularia subglabra TFB-10046 SS5]
MTLDESHRLTVYNTVYSVLKAIDTPAESSQLEDVVRAVLTAARDACANFSENWNRTVSKDITHRLPPEILADCFRAGDFTTRVRASHVSRAWRAVALGDRRLWTTFSRSSFRDLDDQQTAFDQLETMLQRSDPLPFCVQLPHNYHGGYEDYEEPLPCILSHGVHRIQEYSGPCWAFSESNYDVNATYPKLLSFSCLNPVIEEFDFEDLEVSSYWSHEEMPNLRRLAGPILLFREVSSPLTSLTSLCFHLSEDWPGKQRGLFRSCPNLVSLELRSVKESSALPSGPLPTSLREVTLRSVEDDGIDFEGPLAAWRDYRIPRLTIGYAHSLSTAITTFLALPDKPVALSVVAGLGGVKVTLSGDQLCREIRAPRFWLVMTGTYVEELRPLIATRITSVAFPFENLPVFVHSGLVAPRLSSLEVTFGGTWYILTPAPNPLHRLNAPNLRHLIINVPDSSNQVSDDGEPSDDEGSLDHAISNFVENLRTFIAYDAARLDTFTFCCARPDLIDHPELAQIAKEYIVTS